MANDERDTEEKIKCPKCGSTQLHAHKQGFMRGGLLGMGKIIMTCLNCGKKFRPGQGV